MANCEQYWILISGRLDGTLTPEEEARLNAHLAHCPDCRAMLEELSAVQPALSAVEQPSAGFADRVMAACADTPQDIPFTALEQNRDPKKFARERMHTALRPLRTIGALAACCLLIFGVSRFALGGGSGSSASVEEAAAAASEIMDSVIMADSANEESAMAAADEPAEATVTAEAEDTASAEFSLALDGNTYVFTDDIVSDLPQGFVSGGTLTQEQSARLADTLGYAAGEYYLSADDPSALYVRGENGSENCYLRFETA